MKKIPLEETIIESYKFLFQNIISIIGTVWLPSLLLVAVIGATLASIVPHAWLSGDFTPLADPEGYVRSHIPALLLAVPVLFITSLLCSAMIRVGILRLALGQTTSTTWVWFSLGSRVWRLIAAQFLGIAVYIGVVLAVVVVISIVGVVLKAIPNMPNFVVVLMTVVLVIAGFVWGIYTLLRMFFFLPAVIVDENRIGVGRSWELGKGNVWRMIVVSIAVVFPVMIVFEMALYATVFSTIASIGFPHPGPQSPAEVGTMLKSLAPVLPILAGLYILMILSIIGLTLGAVGKAYKAVTAGDGA